jgi:hypothetical protein
LIRDQSLRSRWIRHRRGNYPAHVRLLRQFSATEALARIFGHGVNPLPNLAPAENVAPTNDCAVVAAIPGPTPSNSIC